MKIEDPETYAVIGAAMEVHREMGCGFLEAVYQECMEIEMGLRGIPFVPEAMLEVRFKERALKKKYKADFLVYEGLVVELKAHGGLTGHDQAQTINYLSATGCRRALLLNFGTASLEYRRLEV